MTIPLSNSKVEAASRRVPSLAMVQLESDPVKDGVSGGE